jgi:hypothetical protein
MKNNNLKNPRTEKDFASGCFIYRRKRKIIMLLKVREIW